MQGKLLGIISVDLDATGQETGGLIKYSHCIWYSFETGKINKNMSD
jgi:hypothetical protein